ncbi:MAG: hypothetical protein FJ102_15065 [Deltaproteobacteria bacterium]|nr:hypothetical protein [Deltaproteobacteria bacterium]
MGRWVGALLGLGLVALLAARLGVEPRREAWIAYATARDGTVLHFRYAVGNTGVYESQLTSRVAILRDDLHALEHRSINGPATLDDAGVHGAPDGIEIDGDGAELRVTGDGLRAHGRIQGAGSGCPPATGRARVLVNVPGISADTSDGDLYEGTGFLVRTVATGNVSASALYAAAAAGGLVIDPLATCPAWLALGAERWAGPVAPVPSDLERFELSMGAHRLRVVLGRRQVVQDAHAHALLGERLLAWVAGFPSPVVVLRRVRVQVDDLPERWPGIHVTRTTR